MLVQSRQGIELVVAQIAFVPIAVPRPASGLVRGRAAPSNEVLRDDAVLVAGPHDLVYPVAVEPGRAGAAAGLEVRRHARGRGEVLLAEWAADGIVAEMDARSQVLWRARRPAVS